MEHNPPPTPRKTRGHRDYRDDRSVEGSPPTPRFSTRPLSVRRRGSSGDGLDNPQEPPPSPPKPANSLSDDIQGNSSRSDTPLSQYFEAMDAAGSSSAAGVHGNTAYVEDYQGPYAEDLRRKEEQELPNENGNERPHVEEPQPELENQESVPERPNFPWSSVRLRIRIPYNNPVYPTLRSDVASMIRVSIARLVHYTDIVARNGVAGTWAVEGEFAGYTDDINAWSKTFHSLRTTLSTIASQDPPPRHGGASYAFTQLALDKVIKANEAIARVLVAMVNGTIPRAVHDHLDIIEGMKRENEKMCGFLYTAFQSDQSNEVKGKSWCYGRTDWIQGFSNPKPQGWKGGRYPRRMEKGEWPGIRTCSESV